MDYSAWTQEALDAEFVRLAGEFARIGNERQAILKEKQFRETQASARARLLNLRNDAERDALRAMLK